MLDSSIFDEAMRSVIIVRARQLYNDIIKWIGATIRITHFRAKNFSVN